MKVRDCMTPEPATIDQDSSIESALQLMDELNIRHLPVVEGERLIGVISDRDLIGSTGWRVLGAGEASGDGPRWVRDVMADDVVSVAPDDEVQAALVEVSVRSIGCLPVLDGGRLDGIVSEMDLIRLLATGPDRHGFAGESLSTIAKSDAMSARADATLGQLDALMDAKGIRHVPIVADGALVGIVSDRDMRRAMGSNVASDARADSFMTENVVTIEGGLSIADAARVLDDRRVSALVVTDESRPGAFGIVTLTDLLEYALQAV